MGDILKATLAALSSESPDFKRALKILIKFEIYSLLQRLSDVGEEAVVITASPDDGANGHLGSNRGEDFLRQSKTVHSLQDQFLVYCRALSNISGPQIGSRRDRPGVTVSQDDHDLCDATARSLLSLSQGHPQSNVQSGAENGHIYENEPSFRQDVPASMHTVSSHLSEPSAIHGKSSGHVEPPSTPVDKMDGIVDLSCEPVDLSGVHDHNTYRAQEQVRSRKTGLACGTLDGCGVHPHDSYPESCHRSLNGSFGVDSSGGSIRLMEVKAEPIEDSDLPDVHMKGIKGQDKASVTETISSIEQYEQMHSDAGNRATYMDAIGDGRCSPDDCDEDCAGSQAPSPNTDCDCTTCDPAGVRLCTCISERTSCRCDSNRCNKLVLYQRLVLQSAHPPNECTLAGNAGASDRGDTDVNSGEGDSAAGLRGFTGKSILEADIHGDTYHKRLAWPGPSMNETCMMKPHPDSDNETCMMKPHPDPDIHEDTQATVSPVDKGMSKLSPGNSLEMSIPCETINESRDINPSPSAETSPTSPSRHTWMPLRFGCHYCGQVFKNRQYRDIHEKIHEPKYKYLCVACGEGFEREPDYQAHQHTHTEPLLQCDHCGYRTQKKFRMNMHKEICGVTCRVFSCPYCGKQFSAKRYMKVHMKSHDMTNVHHCPFCQNTYPLKNSLLKHIKKKHAS